MTDKQIIDEQLNAETESGLCSCGSGLEASIMINPYALEIGGVEIEEEMCDECYYQACMDI